MFVPWGTSWGVREELGTWLEDQNKGVQQEAHRSPQLASDDDDKTTTLGNPAPPCISPLRASSLPMPWHKYRRCTQGSGFVLRGLLATARRGSEALRR